MGWQWFLKLTWRNHLLSLSNWTNVHVCAHALAYDSVRVHVKLKGCWFSSKRIFGNLKKNLSISLTSMTTQSKKYYRQSGLPSFDSLILDSPGRFGDLRYLDEGCWGMLHHRISKQKCRFSCSYFKPVRVHGIDFVWHPLSLHKEH